MSRTTGQVARTYRRFKVVEFELEGKKYVLTIPLPIYEYRRSKISELLDRLRLVIK